VKVQTTIHDYVSLQRKPKEQATGLWVMLVIVPPFMGKTFIFWQLAENDTAKLKEATETKSITSPLSRSSAVRPNSQTWFSRNSCSSTDRVCSLSSNSMDSINTYWCRRLGPAVNITTWISKKTDYCITKTYTYKQTIKTKRSKIHLFSIVHQKHKRNNNR